MSFLPARKAVQTSVLSRRWRDMWCSMPCINIDEEEFKVQAKHRIIKERWDKFVDFTTNLLLFHRNSVSLDKFRINAHLFNKQNVDTWIRLGIKYCPSVLEIVIPCYEDNGPFKLPHIGSNLCRLTRLSLSIAMLNRHFAEVLGSGCPALVDLELGHCFNCLQDIKSATVKKLVIKNCFNLHPGCLTVITMPSLASLELIIGGRFDQNVIYVCNAGSLVKASVYIHCNESFCAENRRKLLGGLNNVMSLDLNNFDTLAMLNKHSDNFPMFPNMRVLSLERCFLDDECDLHSKLADLGSFLENAPCLEKLTLWCCMFSTGSGLDSDIERKSISLQSQDGKILQCPKLELIEVMCNHDSGYLLVELLWHIARRLPDARVILTKI